MQQALPQQSARFAMHQGLLVEGTPEAEEDNKDNSQEDILRLMAVDVPTRYVDHSEWMEGVDMDRKGGRCD